ncbi:hypothetical protein RZS08_48695, partial [Arthrospira platensis SPKY1]|nr:hypothetical protein [Arthrospira platensis SPKY1]
MFHVQPSLVNPAAHQGGGVLGKAPVGAIVRTGPIGPRFEDVDVPLAPQHLGVGVRAALAQPDVGVSVWVDPRQVGALQLQVGR